MTRRKVLSIDRFYGNGKNLPLTVTKMGKFLRHRQIIPTAYYYYKNQWKPIRELPHDLLLSPEKLNALPRAILNKTIEHYIPRTKSSNQINNKK